MPGRYKPNLLSFADELASNFGMNALSQLLGRTLVLVAHPDDEAIGCGALLQRMADPVVVFATDGAPEDPYFWGKYGSREQYGAVRHSEVTNAMAAVGVRHWTWLQDDAGKPFMDQTLFRRLPEAIRSARKTITTLRPSAIVAPAYEGGHPDHDACSFIAVQVGVAMEFPVWEMPLYHRDADGKGVLQRFICPTGDELEIVPTPEEANRKRAMCRAYVSQDVAGLLDAGSREFVRPMAEYDYTQRPHDGPLNYEIWGWRMTGDEVSSAFRDFLYSDLRTGTARR